MPSPKDKLRSATPSSTRFVGAVGREPIKFASVVVSVRTLFILSPAKITGARAGFLLNPKATFALAVRLHAEGLPLGEVFAFASGLYFRGKITYARHFAAAATGNLVRVITSNAGLLDPQSIVTPAALRAFGEVDIDPADPRYRVPLRRDARKLSKLMGPQGQIVLLGSIATPKYREVLLECFGERLVFPQDFVGRGDMSRGALLLRAAKAGVELTCQSVQGAVYRGKRTPKLGPL